MIDELHMHDISTRLLRGNTNISTGEYQGNTEEFCLLNLESVKSRVYCNDIQSPESMPKLQYKTS
jgi:hypothetical protein